MKCEQVERVLDDYLDGVLPADEVRELERHLDECPECARSFGGLIATVRELEALPDPEAPADLVPAVIGRLEERRVVEQALPAYQVGWALGLAGAVLTALILILLPGVVWIACTVLSGLGASVAAALGALPHLGALAALTAVTVADAVDGILKVALALDLVLLGAVLVSIWAWINRWRLATTRVNVLVA